MKANEICDRIIANIKVSDEELTELDFKILLSIYEYWNNRLKEKICDGDTQIKNDIENNKSKGIAGFTLVDDIGSKGSLSTGSMDFIGYKAKKGSQGYLLKYDKTIDVQKKDQMIITGLINEDSSVYNYIFSEFYPKILGMIKEKNGTDPMAEEVFLDALNDLILQVKKPNFQCQNNILGLFYRICENKWFDLYKSENKLLFQKSSYEKIDIDEYDLILNKHNPKEKKRVDLSAKIEIDKFNDKKGFCGQVNSDPYITKAVFEYLDNCNLELANIIYYKYIYGFDYDEISQFSTYKNANSVKTQISKVRKELINYCQRIL